MLLFIYMQRHRYHHNKYTPFRHNFALAPYISRSCYLDFNADEDYTSEWEVQERPLSRCRSARTPRTPRALSPRRKIPEAEYFIQPYNERNKQRHPVSARDKREPSRTAYSRRTSLVQRPAFTIY